MEPLLHAKELIIKHPKTGEFSPIPVKYVYPPVTPNGSLWEEFNSGKIKKGFFSPAQSATKPWKIAVLIPHLKDPFWLGVNYGIIEQAKRMGVEVHIFVAEGYHDLIGQLAQMDEAIAAKVDAIILSPISMTENDSSVAKAKAAGIPVFMAVNDMRSDDLTVKINALVYDMGRKSMEWIIADAIKSKRKSINVAMLPGPDGAGWVMAEVDGTKNAIKNASINVNMLEIKYGESGPVEQASLTEELIKKFGSQMDYLIVCNVGAFAAVLPIKEAGLLGKIKIVGNDLVRDSVLAIQRGEISAASDTRGIDIVRVAFNTVINYLEGRLNASDIPHDIILDVLVVDQSNFDHYPFSGSLPPENFKPTLHYKPNEPRY
ncbi:MAG: TMAO reductase system periplasmic protein TorT [Candidatus Magnetomorum sp.]|nr:TMAO reductase system periplasmic protein TorT [Candidatus Magnetomorum sp.]